MASCKSKFHLKLHNRNTAVIKSESPETVLLEALDCSVNRRCAGFYLSLSTLKHDFLVQMMLQSKTTSETEIVAQTFCLICEKHSNNVFSRKIHAATHCTFFSEALT